MLIFLTNVIDSVLHDRPSVRIIVTGDFNQMNLNLLCNCFNLRKVVKVPTRGKNTLDQILTNMFELYNVVQHLPPLGHLDHQCLLLQPKVKPKVKPYTRQIREMKPANIKLLGHKLNLEEWKSVFDAHCVDEKVCLFTATLVRHLDETLPVRTIHMHPTDKPWMTPRIKKELKARQHAYTIGDINEYKKLCDKVSGLISKAKESYYLKTKDLRTSQSEKWYKTIYGLATINDSPDCIPPAEVNEYLAEQLQQAFIRPWQNICPTDVPDFQTVSHLLKDVPPPLPSIGQVKYTLRHLKPKKTTGADGIPAWLLKRFNEELALRHYHPKYTLITLASVSYLRSLVVRAVHQQRTGVGSIPAGGPIVDEFFSTVPG